MLKVIATISERCFHGYDSHLTENEEGKKSDGFNTFSWQKMYFIFFPGNRNEMLIPQKSDEPKPEKSQPVMDIGTCL